jgi:hypothetical protein
MMVETVYMVKNRKHSSLMLRAIFVSLCIIMRTMQVQWEIRRTMQVQWEVRRTMQVQ